MLDEFEEELTEYRRLVAVTFPVGKPFTNAAGEHLKVEIPTTLREEMRQRGIPVVRAHLPFDPISGTYPSRGVLGQDLNLVANALNMFGGSMSLCVQAIVMACDAGEVQPGDHVIALTSDTAILAQAAPTANMLKGLAIREVLCKPAIYTIGRNESVDQLAMPLEVAEQPRPLSSSSEGKILPPAGLDPTK
ncbi:MAG: hypothetical protein ACM3JB_23735 [Acidobacteriaceae bacterium]